MIKLNTYINEAWGGVKKYTNNAEIEAWCEEMGIEDYTINSKGEIDVDGNVNLRGKDFKELPYKFGIVKGYFSLGGCENLTSLKNCPNEVREYFTCNLCENLKSLEGCPKTILAGVWCNGCGKVFNEKYIRSMCPNLKGPIFN